MTPRSSWYVAGRLRSRLTGGAADEIEFRDGVHGLLLWALATLLAGLLTLGAAQALTRLTAPTGGQAAGATPVQEIAFSLSTAMARLAVPTPGSTTARCTVPRGNQGAAESR